MDSLQMRGQPGKCLHCSFVSGDPAQTMWLSVSRLDLQNSAILSGAEVARLVVFCNEPTEKGLQCSETSSDFMLSPPPSTGSSTSADLQSRTLYFCLPRAGVSHHAWLFGFCFSSVSLRQTLTNVAPAGLELAV